MGGGRAPVAQNVNTDILIEKGSVRKPVLLNLGCGLRKLEGFVNVDGFETCRPDILWNLNDMPWPWPDESVDSIYCNHVMEHLVDWMAAFKECARVLKVGGTLQVNVPDHTSTASVGYIDHLHVLSLYSFHMILGQECRGTNAWAIQQGVIPLVMVQYVRVPYTTFVRWWFPKRLLKFCCDHLVNFCHEQRFSFIKIGVAP
jgi:SAM-dependent methyltransferase